MPPLSITPTSKSVAGVSPPADRLMRPLALLADGIASADLEQCNATRRQGEILRALQTRPMHDFAIDSLVVVEGGYATPAIRIRMDGDSWSIDTLEAACFAVVLRCVPERDLRCAGLFADAFALAAREAEAKLERHNAFCASLAVEEEG